MPRKQSEAPVDSIDPADPSTLFLTDPVIVAELPKRPGVLGVGRKRADNPMDELVQKSYDNASAIQFTVNPEAVPYVLRMIQNAANYLNVGVDKRADKDTGVVTFQARMKRVKKAGENDY